MPALPGLGVAWASRLFLVALCQPGAGLAPGRWRGCRAPAGLAQAPAVVRERPQLRLACGAAGV